MEPEAREVLLEWLRAGAPAVTARRCDVSDGGDDAEADDGAVPTPPDACADNACGDGEVDAGHDGAADAAPE